MMGTVAAWDDDYARLVRASLQLRATGARLPPGASRDAQIHSIFSGIDRLLNKLQHIPLMVGEVNQWQMCITFFFFFPHRGSTFDTSKIFSLFSPLQCGMIKIFFVLIK
jgi:hypothetical protein